VPTPGQLSGQESCPGSVSLTVTGTAAFAGPTRARFLAAGSGLTRLFPLGPTRAPSSAGAPLATRARLLAARPRLTGLLTHGAHLLTLLRRAARIPPTAGGVILGQAGQQSLDSLGRRFRVAGVRAQAARVLRSTLCRQVLRRGRGRRCLGPIDSGCARISICALDSDHGEYRLFVGIRFIHRVAGSVSARRSRNWRRLP
jgi:hypothetical protein